MSLTYTRRALAMAIDDARYLARKDGRNAWTVATESDPDVFENVSRQDYPFDRTVKGGWTPAGKPLDILPPAKPARARPDKTFDIYARTLPPDWIGQVEGQTRAIAATRAFKTHGPGVILALQGPDSIRQAREQIERHERRHREECLKQARRRARDMKETERRQLAISREYIRRINEERDARHAAEEIRRQERAAKPTPDETYRDIVTEGWERISETIDAALEETEPQPEPEPETAPARKGWHVYRPTDDGLLWAGGTRIARKGDPTPNGNHRSAHFIGNGTAISWQTDVR